MLDFSFKVVVRVSAVGIGAILVAAGAFLVVTGSAIDNKTMIDQGWNMITAGFAAALILALVSIAPDIIEKLGEIS